MHTFILSKVDYHVMSPLKIVLYPLQICAHPLPSFCYLSEGIKGGTALVSSVGVTFMLNFVQIDQIVGT
jgi:hypothetical protein